MSYAKFSQQYQLNSNRTNNISYATRTITTSFADSTTHLKWAYCANSANCAVTTVPTVSWKLCQLYYDNCVIKTNYANIFNCVHFTNLHPPYLVWSSLPTANLSNLSTCGLTEPTFTAVPTMPTQPLWPPGLMPGLRQQEDRQQRTGQDRQERRERTRSHIRGEAIIPTFWEVNGSQLRALQPKPPALSAPSPQLVPNTWPSPQAGDC